MKTRDQHIIDAVKALSRAINAVTSPKPATGPAKHKNYREILRHISTARGSLAKAFEKEQD